MDKKNIEAIYQLSPSQQGMFLESLAASNSGVFIEQTVWTLRGDVNVQVIERAFQQVVNRHTILRTAFVWKDQSEPLQVVLREAKVSTEYNDWRKIPPSKQREILNEYLKEQRINGFNLAKAPLLSIATFQISDNEYYFVRNTHHILTDGWSSGIINKEFLEFYQAYAENRDLVMEPAKPYRDYIAWLKLQKLSDAEMFWRGRLNGFTKPIQIGIDTGISLKPNVSRYDEEIVSLPSSTSETLIALARQNRITLNTLVQAVYALLLKGYTGESDIVFGYTVSGRPGDLPDVETIVGLFFNTLPLRIQNFPEESDFWSYAREIQIQIAEQKSYEYCSTGQIHEWSELPGYLPLYESILVFENFPRYSSEQFLSNLKIDLVDTHSIGARTKNDLTILIFPSPGLKVKAIYNKQRFDRSRITKIMGHFMVLLESIAAKPDQKLKALISNVPLIKTKKVKRQTLDARRETLNVDFVAPRDDLEVSLAGIWEEVLGIQPIGIRDDFFLLGKHSLVAVKLFSQIQQTLGKNLPITTLFQAPTIERLANVIRQYNPASLSELLVPIQTGGSKPPFFFIHGCGGEVMFYGRLASYLGGDQPFYGIRAQGMYGEKPPHKNIKEMAACYVDEIRKFQPEGPYYIGTAGDGGFVAFEMAQQLLAQNQKIGLLLLVDAIAHADRLARLAQAAGLSQNSSSASESQKITDKPKLTISALKKAVRNKLGKYKWKFAYSFIPRRIKSIQRYFNYIEYVRLNISWASGSYVPKMYPGKITYFLTEKSQRFFGEFWHKIAPNGLDVHIVPGDHVTAWKEPNVQMIAEQLKICLEKARNDV